MIQDGVDYGEGYEMAMELGPDVEYYFHGAWTVKTRGDWAQNANRNAMHGNNTLISNIGVLDITDGKGVYHHSLCGLCLNFERCKVEKNVNSKTNYCQYRTNRFVAG